MPSNDFGPNGVEPTPDTVIAGNAFIVTVTVGPCFSLAPETPGEDIDVDLSYAVEGGGTLPLTNAPTSLTISSGQLSGDSSSIGTTQVGAETVVIITATRTTDNCGTVSAWANVTIQP